MEPYDTRDWVRHLFPSKGSVLPLILPKLGFILILALGTTWLLERHWLPHLPAVLVTVVGTALGLCLTFRVNAGYDRFWEGRKAWGMMLNRSRNLVRQWSYVDDGTLTRDGARLLAGFAHAAKRQLWREGQVPELERLLGAERAAALHSAPGPAQNCLHALGQLAEETQRRSLIDSMDRARFEKDITELGDQLGACERIKATPIPLAFAIHLRQLVVAYCVLLPMALHDTAGWWSPVLTALVALVFVGLDRAGVEIEDPFEHTVNALDLEGMAGKIERDVVARTERETRIV